MVNFNGKILPKDTYILNSENRGLRYGDALFETMRAVSEKVYFLEEHYLRLMASMRILRMEIPMELTMEFFESQIRSVVQANHFEKSPVRIRFTIFRNDGGLYLPDTNTVSYIVEADLLDAPFYILDKSTYEVELFKDFYLNPDMLSTLKTANKLIHVTGSIFAKENDYHNCLLLNNSKQVVEALNGNFFLVKGNTIKTPPLKDGCLKGIIRKKLIDSVHTSKEYTLVEESISPFELQKADELFLTNSIVGIRSITKYRKKEYGMGLAAKLLGRLNAMARLG